MDYWASVPHIWRVKGRDYGSRSRATCAFTLLLAILNYLCMVF